MAWSDEQWAMFASILKRGFAARDPFTPEDENVYRLLLDDVSPDAAMRALREIVLDGQALRPRPGEIVARARRDPSRPSFDEAYRLIFGTGGALRATPHRANGVVTYTNESERQSLYDQAAVDRAREFHPLVASFVIRHGVSRLRTLPVDDPAYGELRRKELREAWEKHVEMFDDRELAALAAGDTARVGLRKFDPLAALGVTGPRPELESGT